MDIELCIYYNIVTIWFLFIIQSVNLPPSAHTISSSAHCSTLQLSAAYSQASSASSVHILQQPLHFSAHCSHVQPCTAICSQSSVHTTANCSHLQPPTLQLYHTVHLVKKGKPIPSLAYLQSSSLDEEEWLFIAVHMMKKTG